MNCAQTNIKTLALLFCIGCFSLLTLACSEQSHSDELVEMTSHWVRPTLPGQKVGAAYISFKSQQDLTLTHISADITDIIEIHDMRIDNGVMKMRQLDALAIPKNSSVTLAPGGMHLMLFNLSEPLKAGTKVNFELCFKDDQGEIAILPLSTEVMSKSEAESRYH